MVVVGGAEEASGGDGHARSLCRGAGLSGVQTVEAAKLLLGRQSWSGPQSQPGFLKGPQRGKRAASMETQLGWAQRALLLGSVSPAALWFLPSSYCSKQVGIHVFFLKCEIS